MTALLKNLGLGLAYQLAFEQGMTIGTRFALNLYARMYPLTTPPHTTNPHPPPLHTKIPFFALKIILTLGTISALARMQQLRITCVTERLSFSRYEEPLRIGVIWFVAGVIFGVTGIVHYGLSQKMHKNQMNAQQSDNRNAYYKGINNTTQALFWGALLLRRPFLIQNGYLSLFTHLSNSLYDLPSPEISSRLVEKVKANPLVQRISAIIEDFKSQDFLNQKK